MEKRLKQILGNNEDIRTFLESLTSEDKRALVPILKRLGRRSEDFFDKEYSWEYYTLNNPPFEFEGGRKMSSSTKRLLQIMSYCLSLEDFIKSAGNSGNGYIFYDFILRDEFIKEILPWFVPKWYEEALNSPTKPYYSGHYFRMLELQKQGYISEFKPITIGNSLAKLISESWWGIKLKDLDLSLLEKHDVTLNEHIWYLFDVYEGIDSMKIKDENKDYENYDNLWEFAFRTYLENGKLDRLRFLKGCLKGRNNWFQGLFLRLEPSQNELLQLQEELFQVVDKQEEIEPKDLIGILNLLKILSKDKSFKYADFFSQITNLFNSGNKTRINACLIILGNIAKTQKESHAEVCLKVSELLLETDSKIQTKVAKIIAKYGDKNNEELTNSISLYVDNMTLETKELLKDFINLEDIETLEETFEFEEVNLFSEEHKLAEKTTFDDFLFAMNNKNFTFNDYSKFAKMINKENVSKLDGVFINILKNLKTYHIKDHLNYHFIKYFIEKFPTELKKVKFPDYDDYDRRIFEAEFDFKTLKPEIFMGKIAYKIFKENLDIEVLSVPTHSVCIEPKTLINRLKKYEKHNIDFDSYDFQTAMEQLPFEIIPDGLQEKINELENEEVKDVFNYFYGFKTLKDTKIKRPELWYPSILTRRNSEDFKQQTTIDILEKFPEINNEFEFRIKYPTNPWIQVRYLYIPRTSREIHEKLRDNIYSYYGLSGKYLFNNIDFNYLREIPRVDVDSKQQDLSSEMEHLYKIWYRKNYPERVYLFLAMGLLNVSKEARSCAIDLWINNVSKNLIDSELLGKYLGILEEKEYAPLKRFTDTIVQNNVLQISKTHNEQFLILVDKMFTQINDEPIKGLKKLLELFYEVKHQFPDYKISEQATEKLNIWSETKSLKGLVNKILKV